jgi:hypothetical protein
MAIAKTAIRWLLVTAGCLLLSSLTWGQAWGPRAAVRVEFGAPVRFVQVERRWDDRRWDRDRAWREHEWRERERREEWRQFHRREERREYRRGYYRGY